MRLYEAELVAISTQTRKNTSIQTTLQKEYHLRGRDKLLGSKFSYALSKINNYGFILLFVKHLIDRIYCLSIPHTPVVITNDEFLLPRADIYLYLYYTQFKDYR